MELDRLRKAAIAERYPDREMASAVWEVARSLGRPEQ